ncbi:MAG: PQQ-binding-like beta-propeller repeat protein [Verrucomicrobiota bacterium]
MNRIALVAAALAGWTIAAAGADEWPQFRGPERNGISPAKNLPTEWSADKNVVWKQAVGQGWSSPVLHQGRIFLTASKPGGSGQSLGALCLDAASGKILWNTDVFTPAASPKIHQKNSHASPTPIVEAGRLYVHFGHQGTACLDLKGKVLWRNTELGYPPVHGSGGSPVIVEDVLVFSCDGAQNPFIVALDKATGKVRWKAPRVADVRKKFSFSTPQVIAVKGQMQIVSPGSGAVCALNPKDGKELWRARYGEGYSVIPQPAFGHGMIFLSTGFDRPSLMAIRADGQGDVTDTHVAWTLARGAPHTPSPLLVGDELYLVADSGIASCVDAKTGAVHWSERLGGNFSASPLYADGKIYCPNEQGVCFVLKPGKTFEKLAENSLGERTLASFAAMDGALFIRTETQLYRVGKSTVAKAAAP